HTRFSRDWSSDVCSSDLELERDMWRALRRALLQRDYVALPQVVAETGLPESKQRLLNELPRLQGRGEAIERALSLADNDGSRARSEERRVGKEVRPGWVP